MQPPLPGVVLVLLERRARLQSGAGVTKYNVQDSGLGAMAQPPQHPVAVLDRNTH